MKNLLAKCFPYLTPETIYSFLSGMLCCLFLLILALLLFEILWLACRRSRKATGVTLETEHGSVFIAAGAIADLVRSLGAAFPELTITKVRLHSVKKELLIQVWTTYSAGNQSMLDLADNFQARALELLKKSFGIDTIQKIDLIVPKGNG